MRRLFFTILLLASLSGCRDRAVGTAIRRQLDAYPASRVQDIYKSFCQDYLGPEHLIPNPQAARDYLDEELASYREDLDSLRYGIPDVRYYPVGDRGNYVRVDLSVILDGLVGEDELLDAFVRSANAGKTVSPEAWKAKWGQIAKVIRRDFPELPQAAEDLARIDSLVAAGNLILHHSETFGQEYHPHYRIIAKDIFEQELKAKTE
ncbi:MAG: hypothetical protein K5849_02765 [Bacteroidales bacterium]|nr:hypothetical protein [Bacteroidales bacterium]